MRSSVKEYGVFCLMEEVGARLLYSHLSHNLASINLALCPFVESFPDIFKIRKCDREYFVDATSTATMGFSRETNELIVFTKRSRDHKISVAT